MIVGQVCNPYVVTIEAGSSVYLAARLMRERHVGDLIVVDDDGLPMGIITDRDIVVGLVAQEITDLERLHVDEVITRELVTIDETDTVADAAEVMREHGIRRLPVTDPDGMLVGIFTLDDALTVLSETLEEMAGAVHDQRAREERLRS